MRLGTPRSGPRRGPARCARAPGSRVVSCGATRTLCVAPGTARSMRRPGALFDVYLSVDVLVVEAQHGRKGEAQGDDRHAHLADLHDLLTGGHLLEGELGRYGRSHGFHGRFLG